MDNEAKSFFGGVFVCFLVMLSILIWQQSISEAHPTIIKHGCAQYNPITGDFEWKEHKDD